MVVISITKAKDSIVIRTPGVMYYYSQTFKTKKSGKVMLK